MAKRSNCLFPRQSKGHCPHTLEGTDSGQALTNELLRLPQLLSALIRLHTFVVRGHWLGTTLKDCLQGQVV